VQALREHELSDAGQQPADERLAGHLRADLVRDAPRGGRAHQAAAPVLVHREALDAAVPGDRAGERERQRHQLHGPQTERHRRLVDVPDLLPGAEHRRVREPQQLRDERGVLRDGVREVLDARVLVLGEGEHLDRHRREAGEVLCALDEVGEELVDGRAHGWTP
jgi:hypothetical protein